MDRWPCSVRCWVFGADMASRRPVCLERSAIKHKAYVRAKFQGIYPQIYGLVWDTSILGSWNSHWSLDAKRRWNEIYLLPLQSWCSGVSRRRFPHLDALISKTCPPQKSEPSVLLFTCPVHIPCCWLPTPTPLFVNYCTRPRAEVGLLWMVLQTDFLSIRYDIGFRWLADPWIGPFQTRFSKGFKALKDSELKGSHPNVAKWSVQSCRRVWSAPCHRPICHNGSKWGWNWLDLLDTFVNICFWPFQFPIPVPHRFQPTGQLKLCRR